MRQVSEAELVWTVLYRLRRLSAAVRNGLADPRPEQRRRYEQFAAEAIVKDGLGRYEVLTDTPLPLGSDLYTRAAYGGGDGSSPTIEAPGA